MMKLSSEQVEQYHCDGIIVLPNFVSADSCAELRHRAETLVAEFDPNEAVSIFSTHEQARTSDDYLLCLRAPSAEKASSSKKNRILMQFHYFISTWLQPGEKFTWPQAETV